MNEIQVALPNMMIDVDKKLKSEGIFYYIDSGNAIGALRHKGFIPWDDDIDICILRKDVNKFKKAIKSMDGYFLQEPFSIDWYHNFYKIKKNNTTAIEKNWKNTRMHHGLFIDVFVMENYPDSPTARYYYDWLVCKTIAISEKGFYSKKDVFFKCASIISKILYLIMDATTNKHCKCVTQRNVFRLQNTYDKKYIEKTINIEYETYQLPIPIGIDEMLKIKYGDYMKLPPENERVGTHLLYFSKDVDYKDFIEQHKELFE